MDFSEWNEVSFATNLWRFQLLRKCIWNVILSFQTMFMGTFACEAFDLDLDSDWWGFHRKVIWSMWKHRISLQTRNFLFVEKWNKKIFKNIFIIFERIFQKSRFEDLSFMTLIGSNPCSLPVFKKVFQLFYWPITHVKDV